MRWTGGAWTGGGPALPGASVGAPGALARALLRLVVAGLVLGAFAALVLLPDWGGSPAPQPPEVALHHPHPHVPGPAETESSTHARRPEPAAPDRPQSGEGAGGAVGTEAGPFESTAPESSSSDREAGPQPERERIHEHVYDFDFRGAGALTILGALLALALAFFRLPRNPWLAALVGCLGGLFLWFGIDVVYAGQFPEVFDYRETFYEDGVEHIVTEFDHRHPVIVQIPLVILGVGALAWSGWILWRTARAERRQQQLRAGVGSA
jgi:hypothetical protein